MASGDVAHEESSSSVAEADPQGPAAVAAPEIRAIERSAVAKICSGQVVVDLPTAVKELVENALDADATHIEIKLKEWGVDAIEVSDNGSGVAPKDYQGLTLKYHTSKISGFGDIWSVQSFGFRGEALSSLCEISGKFEVTTRTQEQSTGTRLTYDRTGKIASQEPVARQRGTTVSIMGLFEPLPVRRAELKRTVSKQSARLLRVLQGYALVCTGVRLTCSNIKGPKATRQVVLSTQGSQTMRENIINVFGASFASTLQAVELVVAEEGGEGDGKAAEKRLSGFVSRTGEGVGRSDNDRQFFFLNGRPVDLPRLTRLVNDVWRVYEMKRKPAAILNIDAPAGSFDVNVTPDKREVLLVGEAALLEQLKETLTGLWQSANAARSFELNEAQVMDKREQQAGAGQKRRRQEDEEEEEEGGGGGEEAEVPAGKRPLERARGAEEGADEEEQEQPAVSRRRIGEAREEGRVEETEEPKQDRQSDAMEADEEEADEEEADEEQGEVEEEEEEGGRYVDDEEELQSEDEQAAAAVALELPVAAPSTGPPASRGDGRSGKRQQPQQQQEEDDDEEEDVVEEEEVEEREAPVSVRSVAASHDLLSRFGADVGGGSRGSLVAAWSSSGAGTKKAAGKDNRRSRDGARLAGGVGSMRRFLSANGEGGGSPGPSSSSLRGLAVVRPSSSSSSSSRQRLMDSLQEEEEEEEGEGVDATGASEEGTEEPVEREAEEMEVEVVEERSAARSPSKAGAEDEEVEVVAVSQRTPSGSARKGRRAGPSTEERLSSLKKASQGSRPFLFDPQAALRKAAKKPAPSVAAEGQGSSSSLSASLPAECSTDPERGKDVEAAARIFSRVLTKDHFHRMVVLGQFNLGFIIVRVGSDIFILDQHACDEKYNFETLQSSTTIHEQKLICPLPIEVSAMEEVVILDNLHIFRKNGFQFVVDEDAPPMRRLKVTALPYSKSVQFGVEDIHELASQLSDNPGQMMRLPKVRAMFASRACRMSIMIGRALTRLQMVKVVRNLAKIEQPWNCPHGRPTMRHLVDLNRLEK